MLFVGPLAASLRALMCTGLRASNWVWMPMRAKSCGVLRAATSLLRSASCNRVCRARRANGGRHWIRLCAEMKAGTSTPGEDRGSGPITRSGICQRVDDLPQAGHSRRDHVHTDNIAGLSDFMKAGRLLCCKSESLSCCWFAFMSCCVAALALFGVFGSARSLCRSKRSG